MSVRKVSTPKVTSRAVESAAPKATNKVSVPQAARTAETVSAPGNKLAGTSKSNEVISRSIDAGAAGIAHVSPGPLSLRSKTAKDAIEKSLAKINQNEAGGGITYSARQVEADELGMVHVRLDREYKGIKVFGEQLVSHLNAKGEVALVNGDEAGKIPASVAKDPKLTSAQALEIATKAFNSKTDVKPTIESVIVKNAEGKYVRAYRAELTNVSDGDPRKMNYLVDANSGKVIDQWNQIDAFFKKGDLERMKARAGAAAEPKTYDLEDAAAAAIEDNASVERTLHNDGDENFSVDGVKLSLDADHTWPGDLTVKLTSPSGKEVTVWDRKPGSLTDLKGSVDLSDFNGESASGDWKLTVTDSAGRDVGTLNKWSLSIAASDKTPPPPPPNKADDQTMYSGKVEIGSTKNADGTFNLSDANRGKGVKTRDANNASSASGAKDINDNNDLWGEATDDVRAKAAVDAQYGGQMTYDFYKDILGRDSIDGKGEALVSNVHIKKNYVNAYWDGTQMNYGDGDGRNSTELTALDIAGHEITHGLTERTAGLVYRGESGGLNEAFSDIMGKGVEWYASSKNPDVKFTWGVGERVWTPGTPGDALRYMDDPTKDQYSVDNYKNYPKQTEVHGSSGIANNAFVLLVQGGKNRTSGIEVKSDVGMEKALKIYGRALTTYMTPSTTFAQARTATIQAATDLYGADSVEVQKVKESWTAVGVN